MTNARGGRKADVEERPLTMRPFKTTCTACGFSYFWAGVRAEAATACRNCGAARLVTVPHDDSPAGQLLVEYLVGNSERPRRLPALDDDIDPRYADGHPPAPAAA